MFLILRKKTLRLSSKKLHQFGRDGESNGRMNSDRMGREIGRIIFLCGHLVVRTLPERS